MKAVVRRLRKLEEKFTPVVNRESQRLVAIIRERRRKRLEAAGIPYVEPVYEPLFDEHGRRLTGWAEILRARRAQLSAEAKSQDVERASDTVAPARGPTENTYR